MNAKAAVVGSIRAYPSVTQLPEPVDLAILSVRAKPCSVSLMNVRSACKGGHRDHRGFAEADEAGRSLSLQKQLLEKVRGYGMRMVGPNCMGLLNTDALFRQTGVIRAETLDEMFAVAAALANQPLPKGRRIGIITNAGGPGILCTDACEAGGLLVPELSAQTRDDLRKFLPAAAGLSNPVDMIASARADSYLKTIDTMLPSPDIDALIVIYIPVDRNDSATVAQAIRDGVALGRATGGTESPWLPV